MKQTLHTIKMIILLIMLIGITPIINAAGPVDYTLLSTDITLDASGYINGCTYDFSANVDGTNLTIPNTLGVKGIADATSDWMGNIDGNDPFIEKNITTIVLPTTLTYIGDYSLSKNNLTSITIPNGVTNIGRDAFLENKIASVIIPASVVSIGSNCFYENSELTTVSFAAGSMLTYIGSHAFVYTNVSTITLPTPIVPDNNFEYWIQLSNTEVHHDGGTTLYPANYGFIAKYDYTLTNDDVVVENGIINELVDGFSEKFLIIPNELDGQTVTGIKGVSSQKDALFYGISIRELTLPNTLETIGKMSFNNNSIKELSIPSSVVTIDDYAFWGALAYNLSTVTFEDDCHLNYIGYQAFANNGVLEVTLPTPIKEGYTFTHWKNDDDDVIDAGSIISSHNYEYTAKFSIGTDVTENKLTRIQVYPNPASNHIILHGAKAGMLKIYDLTGILVKQLQLTVGEERVDISNLAKGIYLIEINNNSFKFQKL